MTETIDPPESSTDPTALRLAKRVSEMFNCSRREAEIYIQGGWVTVDGKVVEEPQCRVSNEEIKLHPDATLEPPEMVTILFNVPLGMVVENETTPPVSMVNHLENDAAGIRPLMRHFAQLTRTLPLEINATGLAVFTQDWRIVRKLVDDANTVEQEYIVEVEGTLDERGLKQLNHGLSFNGRPLAPAKVSWQNETRLRFAVKGTKPGQITHMCKSIGLKIRSIKRIRIGQVSMGKLPAGEWCYFPAGGRF
jgi:23S rRNA pseudouridine2604 synthase